ncbi:alpha/beta hydrolase [Nocardia donostiensis]|uniref:Alpha/beta hydrolase n=1 Tax=Nocardia donostiensis TaxID=1538463 RepID=A0A1W0B9U1_9NOCA|nr:alpha/beta hydrolase [Nocardia donostiensis]ONM46677.1 alpha/beta hydrolase [Nocardia donostiensis]OQS12758.1 alpha/beta hydrolase [Nocardia donostiensis]OQS19300.1 alpha/beta hydrolase [Nocardia donostiensis]
MNDVTDAERPPRGIRLLHALQREPDWSTMTSEELIAFRDAANRKAASRIGRVVTGLPDRGAAIEWQEVTLPDRAVPVRVYRPSPEYGGRDADLPLLLQVHGGGFVGTAVQCDWANSHFAARLPAVVVSVEHRLIAPGTALSAAVDDGWDVLQHVVEHAAEWGVDPARVAVVGESTGGLIAALAAIRAKESGLPLQAQVLVNPVTDLTETMFDYPSMVEHANSPTSTVAEIRFFQRLAVPSGTDPRPLSPLHAGDRSGLAPALVVVPTIDPLADHGRRYAERLLESGTPAQLTEYPGATHAFLSMPGLVPQAKAARAEIAEFLRDRLVSRSAAGSRRTGQR